MKLRIGDKVKFLNEVGGGIISKVVDTKLVHVETDDGFEIPTMIKDLVKIDDGTNEVQVSTNKEQTDVSDYSIQNTTLPLDSRVSKLFYFSSRRKEIPGAYLAFIPQDQQWLMTGAVDIFLVNNTDWEMQFSIYLKKEEAGFRNVEFGHLPAESKFLLASIERDDIDKWLQGFVQINFIKKDTLKVLMPLNSPFKIKVSRFFKEGNYVSPNMINEKCMLVSLVDIRIQNIAANDEYALKGDKLNDGTFTGNIVAEPPLIRKHEIDHKEAEVDLHIHELVDDSSGMDNKEILKTQLDYFHKTLNSAINNDYFKVTFIHGVGSGMLKSKLMEELRDYGVKNKRASITKYGVGALDVLIEDI